MEKFVFKKTVLATALAFSLCTLVQQAWAADSNSTKSSKPAVNGKTASTSSAAGKTAAAKAEATKTVSSASKSANTAGKTIQKTTKTKAGSSASKAASSSKGTNAASTAKAGSSTKASAAIKRPVGPVPVTVNPDGTPHWLDVKSAQAAAKLKHKMIIADFFTDWCGWCKILDKKTLHDPTVEAYLAKNFVCMKVNAQDGAAGEELARQFDVSGFPTIMIYSYNGRKLASVEGFREAPEFLAEIKAALGANAPN